jgi:hypothetical protein
MKPEKNSSNEAENQESWESRNKFINGELKRLQEMLTKRKEELEGLCTEEQCYNRRNQRNFRSSELWRTMYY